MEFQNRNDQNRIFMFRFQWEGEGRVQQLAEMRLCTMKGPQGSSAHILLGRPRKNEVENHVKSSAFTFNYNILLSLYLSLSPSVSLCVSPSLSPIVLVLSQKSPGAIHSATFILEMNMAHVLSGVLRSIPQCNIDSWNCIPRFKPSLRSP